MDFFESVFRFLFAWIDKIVAWLIVLIYNLFELISDTSIFDNNVIEMFNNRIYALLAIFMLFKLAFSFITYIINPDDFSDKSKGFGKLITNVFIVLLLLVSVPQIFSTAYKFQGLIISKGTINKLILGVGGSPSFGENVNAGHIMSFTVYSAFVVPNPNYPGMVDNCDDMYKIRELSSECNNVISGAVNVNGYEKLLTALRQYDAQALLNYDLVVNAKKNGEFLFNYTPIISSICAGVIAWVLLMFCIDISIRVVKLGFLQLIAPIPIITYIDPKSSKDGMFKKWTKLCLSTYADIFVRMIAISFAIFIINIIGTGEMTKLSDPSVAITIANYGFFQWAFVRIFIILGALLFAKQVPKLIEDLTGIKLSGSFTLNPMKKIGESPFASAAIGGALGAGAGAISAFSAKRATGGNIGKALLSGAGGVFAGGGRGLFGGLKSDGKGSPLKAGLDAGGKSGANVMKRNGTDWKSRMSARAASAFGLNTAADIQDNQSKQRESYLNFAKTIDTRAEAEVLKKSDSVKLLKNKVESLKNSGASAKEITKAETIYFDALKQSKADYITNAINQTAGAIGGDDKLVRETIEQMNKLIEKGGEDGAFNEAITETNITQITDGKQMKDFKDQVEYTELKLKGSDEWKKAHRSKDVVSKKK